MNYLIVGGGIAGTTAAEELRKIDAKASITIISDEQHRLYSRVMLPMYLMGKVDRERVFLKKSGWYEKQNIEFLSGERAVMLDIKNKFVRLESGRELPYDKLLITSGQDARVFEQDRKGVAYLRTLDDADHLDGLLRGLGSAETVGILGGGFIAMDFLHIFSARGFKGDLFLRGQRFFSKVLDNDSSKIIKSSIEKEGFRVHQNSPCTELMGEKSLECVRVKNRQYPVSLLGIGIGADPDLSWIKEAGVKVDRGVLTNEYLETSAPGVYAAGDIAEFQDVIVGRRMKVGTWINAIQSARTVANTMAGKRSVFKLVSSYATNALGVEVIFIGDTDKELADRVVQKGSKESGGASQIFIRDDRVVGATLVNRNTDRAFLTGLIKQKTKVSKTIRPEGF